MRSEKDIRAMLSTIREVQPMTALGETTKMCYEQVLEWTLGERDGLEVWEWARQRAAPRPPERRNSEEAARVPPQATNLARIITMTGDWATPQ